jgi:hypothetical protein
MHTYFQIGKFGASLADAYTGLQQHKMSFEYGIYKANAAIENCIGRNTSPIALLLLYPWIKQLYKHRKLLISKLIEVKEEEELDGAYRVLRAAVFARHNSSLLILERQRG